MTVKSVPPIEDDYVVTLTIRTKATTVKEINTWLLPLLAELPAEVHIKRVSRDEDSAAGVSCIKRM